MSVLVAYEVIEHYPDDAPEPFGTYFTSGQVKVNDVITLKWIDGRDAYDVRVTHVHNGTLDVVAVNPEAAKNAMKNVSTPV